MVSEQDIIGSSSNVFNRMRANNQYSILLVKVILITIYFQVYVTFVVNLIRVLALLYRSFEAYYTVSYIGALLRAGSLSMANRRILAQQYYMISAYAGSALRAAIFSIPQVILQYFCYKVVYYFVASTLDEAYRGLRDGFVWSYAPTPSSSFDGSKDFKMNFQDMRQVPQQG